MTLRRVSVRTLVLSALAATSAAQGPGGPGPLPPPPVPPGNPITTAKTNLGRALFWDEQLSSTDTVACGTCHVFQRGGSDPRTSAATAHPGPNGVFGDADDVFGSRGVPQNQADGLYTLATVFGFTEQVTGRKSPSVINSAYVPSLFWDGRADPSFEDPLSGAVVLPNLAALESQAVEPPLSDVEMGHVGTDSAALAAKIAQRTPLRLSPQVPAALATWIAGRDYPALFQEAFGTNDVTPARIAQAIATYERTLVSNQAPFDQLLLGNPQALTPQENQGFQVFNTIGRCNICHAGPRLTNDSFRYIGVRPQDDDLGRFAVTNNPGDRGRMKVPSLRNVELRAPYFHTGRFATLEEVVDFYNRGGDFNAPNKDPNIVPLGLSPQQRANLLAFLRRPLTDPRVVNGTAPFDAPALNQSSPRVPQHFGIGTPGTGGFVPRLVAIEPAYVGNANYTVALEGGHAGRGAIVAFSPGSFPAGVPFYGATSYLDMSGPLVVKRLGALAGSGPGDGTGSGSIAIPNDPLLVGTTFYAQAFVLDMTPGVRFATTDAVAIPRF
jgi:cytochrome c peroxidase